MNPIPIPADDFSTDKSFDILVVDDSPANLNLLVNILGEAGYKVRPANSGELALRSVQAKQPSLILLDIKMPGLDGYEVCQKLKEDEKTRAIPVIFISALESEFDRIKSFKLGGVDYITKPFHSEEILVRVGTHIKLRRTLMDLETAAKDYRMLAENSPDLIARFDTGLRHLYVNAAAAKAGNLRASDYIGLSIAETGVPEATAAVWEERIRKVIDIGETLDVVDSFSTPEGIRYFHTSFVPEFTQDGRVGSVLSVARDITNSKQMEDALRESEEKYHQLFENSLDAVMLTKVDGSIDAANPAACQMFGLTEMEIKQAGRGGLIDRSDPRLVKALQERALKGKFKGELTGIHKNGSKFPVEITSSTFADKNGTMRTSMVIRDISIRIQAEKDLQSAFEQLRLISSRLAELQESERREIAKELHDRVGQSLTALGISLNIIRKFVERDGLTKISPRFDSALNLVAEITAEIRTVMSNLYPPVLEDYGLTATLKWYTENLQQHTGLQIQVFGEEIHPKLSSSVAMALFRIAQEALTNVIKHAATNYAIVRLEEKSDEVVLTIEDKGRGFDPLNITTRENPHWGVITMQERARAVGGFFEISSNPNNGTIVCARIPR
ncbi:PAS domain S-box protein [Candidatus Villigracilis saccharophilus]|uniref:hybrid sensor histidine kinase/response regulator n=1 Tax=Candidatus Villigracilis saccharophilus TaxID=3140684 RepID=UPI00313469C2|nr:PAS domain S-box protein [Anaerolineales bacterium]